MADKYLGTLGGEDFSTAKAAVEWVMNNTPLTDNLNIYTTSNVVDVAALLWIASINLGGYHLKFSVEDSTWNSIKSNHLNWFTLSFPTGCGLFLPIDGSVGTVTIERLKVIATAADSGYPGGGNNALVNASTGTAWIVTFNYRDLIIIGGRDFGVGTCCGLYAACGANNQYINVERVICAEANQIGIDTNISSFSPGDFTGRKFIKNSAIYHSYVNGIEIEGSGGHDWAFDNVWSCENANKDWVYIGTNNSVKRGCADSDYTLPDGEGHRRGITIADEVQSTDKTLSTWLKLIDGTGAPGSQELGINGVDSGLTVDITGEDIPGDDGYYSIGPFEQQYDISGELPIFRYGPFALCFGNTVYAPSFPAPVGLSLHTFPTDKAAYVTTSRLHGTTKFNWKSERFKQADRDIIKTFWDIPLEYGKNGFTVIDHKRRILFEASLNNLPERWGKGGGGTYTIDYPLKSAVPWTLPVYGAFYMVQENLKNHILNGDELTVGDGELVDYTDGNILRENGYALKLENGISPV